MLATNKENQGGGDLGGQDWREGWTEERRIWGTLPLVAYAYSGKVALKVKKLRRCIGSLTGKGRQKH